MYGHDQIIGKLLLLLSSIFIVYYFIWVILLPFVDTQSKLRLLYPDSSIALLVPICTFLFFLITTFGYLLLSFCS